MNRIENYEELKNKITKWIGDYILENPSIKSLVVGVSGGIDSAVVATLCAETGLPTYVLSMPLNSSKKNNDLSDSYTDTLESKYENVTKVRIDLSSVLLIFGLVMVSLLLIIWQMPTPNLAFVW